MFVMVMLFACFCRCRPSCCRPSAAVVAVAAAAVAAVARFIENSATAAADALPAAPVAAAGGDADAISSVDYSGRDLHGNGDDSYVMLVRQRMTRC